MLLGSAAISGTVLNALWLAVVLSTITPYKLTAALLALTAGGPILVFLSRWFALRAFGRGPSNASRAAVLAANALAASFFTACAVVQIVVLEPLRPALAASRAIAFDAVTIALALLPALVLALSTAGLLRMNVAHLARHGFRVGDRDVRR